MRYTIILGMIFYLILCVPIQAGALDENSILRVQEQWPQDDEVIWLPRYCQVRRQIQGRSESPHPSLVPEIRHWQKVLGNNTWTHLHHYCAGLNRLKRYERSKMAGYGGLSGLTELQEQNLELALGEFKYVYGDYKKHRSPLYLNVLINMMTAYSELGLIGQAVKIGQIAIREKPHQQAPYVKLAEVLIRNGKTADAKEVLQLGLRRAKPNDRIKAILTQMP